MGGKSFKSQKRNKNRNWGGGRGENKVPKNRANVRGNKTCFKVQFLVLRGYLFCKRKIEGVG